MSIRAKTIAALLFASQLLISCSVYDFWNGVYSDRAAVRSFEKKEAAFYAKETPQQKELRKKNNDICWELAGRPENRIQEKGWPKGRTNQRLFCSCMKERGTPEYRCFDWR